MTINRTISGGQTGADRAALDVAIELNIPHGGWIPKGRKRKTVATAIADRLVHNFEVLIMKGANYRRK